MDQLSTLLQKESSKDDTPPPSKKGFEAWAVYLPWMLLIGFAMVIGITLAPQWMPARSLNIAQVVTVRRDVQAQHLELADSDTPRVEHDALEADVAFEADTAFQASGWIEPYPLPTLATGLVDGIVESVHILEGDLVQKGQILVKLIDEDARLDLRTAQAEHEAQIARLEAQVRATELIAVKRQNLKIKISAVQAKQKLAQDRYERLVQLNHDTVSEQLVTEAKLMLDVETAELKADQAQDHELLAMHQEKKAMEVKLKADLQKAKVQVERKALALERTVIRSPMDGRVMKLLAAPGNKKMQHMDHPLSATVALLYDPQKLQARLDIPLSEASQLFIGQKVLLKSNFLPNLMLRAEVIRIVGEADLQRNTLQVKVLLQDPDPRLRPDMLCRGEFLVPITEGGSQSNSKLGRQLSELGPVQIYVPQGAIVPLPNENNMATVWVVGPERERVYFREVELGQDDQQGYRLVKEGLRPGDRVVLQPPEDLTPGERFRASTQGSK